ncbi:amidohydrolase family protein [Vulcaniibacterium tengchongense]|uniref:Imidazolonepropionase-like amidohydrolase n=1 Tax=Vulcaniibacterium tengchongense TaxID=1273429 RepID=A0A3N4VRM0_9GAMM|nr:amidohydrolase family protein [Vulcaniibacterium tengchongense]RPE81861.1 imidazolonepropionase-like amidohydrolase [Vulcaniibacterium tengchongense]
MTRRGRAAGYAGLVALALGAADALAAETIRYVALVDGGKQAGHQTVTRGDDGVTRVEFIFKDNGRGPELKEEYVLAEDGTYRRYRVQGTSTFGAKVDERFERKGTKAEWKTTADAGAVDVAGTALYTPLGGAPAAFSVALGALGRRPDGKLPLIPSGALTARKVAQAQVHCGGKPREVHLMAMTGIGLTPTFAWATADASPRLFAYIYPGFLQLIEDGCQADANALETRQKQAEGEVLADLARRLGHRLAGATLIRNARVFDSEHARLGPASDVLVRDGRIVSVAPAGQGGAADQVVEAGGRVLLPGLFDMHGHVGRWDGGLNLASGVTTVRDMGNDNATLQQMLKEIEAGTLMSPDVVPAGFIEGESPFSARNGFVVKTLDEAKKAVDWYAEHGYPQIKIYNSFPKDLLKDTVAYAHAKGLRVSGHVPAFLRAQDAVDAGFDELQHVNQLMLNFFVDDKTDTRTLARFYLVADRTADLDLDGKPVQDFIASLAGKQVAIDPTLATFEFLHQRDGEMSPIVAAVADHLPPDVQRQRKAAEMNIPDDATAARYDRSFAKLVEFVGRAYRAGVPLVAGTDELPGFTLQRELELYVQAGLTPAQVLQVATWNGAKYSRTLDERGSIAPGKRADLVLIDGDPTADISDIRKVALVIKGDTAYYPSEIHEALGIEPFVAPVKVGAAR